MKKGLLSKLVVPNVVSLVTFAMIGYIVISLVVSQMTDKEIKNSEQQVYRTLDDEAQLLNQSVSQLIKSNAQKALEEATLFSKLPTVQQAYKIAYSGNINDPYSPQSQEARRILKSSLTPFVDGYTSYSGEKRFNLHFHLPNGRSLARIWRHGWQSKVNGKKVDISDDISSFRNTVLEVNKSGKPISGIEIGRGGFAIRGLAPIKSNDNKQLGSVEVLTSFSDALIPLDSAQINYGVYMNMLYLKIATKLQDSSKYRHIDSSFVAVSESNQAVLSKIITSPMMIKAQKAGKNLLQLDTNYVAIFPITDYSGKTIGTIVISKSITKELGIIANFKARGKSNLNIIRTYLLLGFLLVIIVISVTTYKIVTNRVVKPLEKVVTLSTEIEKGDLTQQINVEHNDEIGVLITELNKMVQHLLKRAQLAYTIAEGNLDQDVEVFSDKDTLAKALKKMVDNLNNIISNVISVSKKVEVSSKEISLSSQELADDATSQAAALQEIYSTMTEISEQINENAQNTKDARNLVIDMENSSDKGSQQMNKLSTSMEKITESSTEIEKVIKVIDDIAFQTNLLALNAAVEAARAGQHGKGFAVVADEVRNLANRSAKAAKETAKLIHTSGELIEEGNAITKETTETFEVINGKVKEIAEITNKISHASTEQSTAVNEVNTALSELSDTTQKTAAISEEGAAESAQLSAEARELLESLSHFKLKDGESSQTEDSLRTTLLSHQEELEEDNTIAPIEYDKNLDY